MSLYILLMFNILKSKRHTTDQNFIRNKIKFGNVIRVHNTRVCLSFICAFTCIGRKQEHLYAHSSSCRKMQHV